MFPGHCTLTRREQLSISGSSIERRSQIATCMQLLTLHAQASCLLQVLTWGADVMRWLYSTAQHSPDQQTLVVEAFAAWVRLGLLYEQELPQTEVHGLLSLTFQALLHSSEGEQFPCSWCQRLLLLSACSLCKLAE